MDEISLKFSAKLGIYVIFLWIPLSELDQITRGPHGKYQISKKKSSTSVHPVKRYEKRCRLVDYRIASISRLPPVNAVKTGDPRPRETCPPPPLPPPKPPKDDSWFWSAVAVLFLAGTGIMAAKNSPEIRDMLTLYAPMLDDLIAIIYQENMTYREYINLWLEDAKKNIKFKGNEADECLADKIAIEDIPATEKIVTAIKNDEEEEEKCEPLTPPVLTQCICEIERCVRDLGESVVFNYDTAKEACAYYNSLVDETMQSFKLKNLKKLHHAKKERTDLVDVSLKNAEAANNKLAEMIQYLDCGVQATKDEIENTKLLRRNFQKLADATYMKFQWANDEALVRDRQWEMIETIVDKYANENESLYPLLKYKSKRPILEGDPDILLYNTYRYINQLNSDLAKASSAMSERVNRAYNMLKGDAEKDKVREARLQAALVIKRCNLDKEFKKRYEDQKANNEKLLKDMTALQLQKHLELLATRLTQKENDIQDKFEDMVEERVTAEKRVFDMQLANMAVKLKQVEDKLNVRLKAERETRRSQELWSAGASLLAATKKGDPYVNVNKKLEAIEKAAGNEDKLVLTVLKSIPPSVRQQGIVPESVLREKYKIMERTALRVALVEEDGGVMPVYILSWIQSLLLFMKLSGIPQAEYDSPPKEPSKDLDTYDLLQRSRFWLEQGNLAMALKYVDSLKGASRLAAHYWYEAARAHLEVRQAAEAVLAHAAAMGLQYI